MMTHTDVTYGLGPDDIARMTGVDVTTARRWKRDATRIPEPARRLLNILTTGELARFAQPWRGWSINPRGFLVSPEQWEFTPGQVCSIPFLHGMVASYQSQVRAVEARFECAKQCDWVEARYVEPDELREEIDLAHRPERGRAAG